MNVSLIFKQTGYNFQISQFTPLSFIYEVSNKVFHIPINTFKLFFKEQYVPNEPTYASSYFKKFPVIINILESKNNDKSNFNEKTKTKEEKSFLETYSEKVKPKKKNYIKCQICNKKNSIFYCRNCNQFICFECNLRFPEHFSHKKISLESGDLLLCFEDYRNSVLEQLNELNNAYRFSSENIFTDQKRSEFFDNLLNTLKELDKKTQSLTIMGTSYRCNNEVLNSFNKELREIEPPKFKEETINSFGLVNEKELEIHNYISFINLQILKSKFNIKMNIFFKETKKIFDDLTLEINNKLHDSLNLKEKDYNDLVSYNKERYKEQRNSSSSTPNYSSFSDSSKHSINRSLSLNSNNSKNDEENKLSDKFSSNKSIHSINNKIDINKNIRKNSKNNSKLQINLVKRNENNNHNSLFNLKTNHTEGNLNKIKSMPIIVKYDEENNEPLNNNLASLPKIKIGNDTNIEVNTNKYSNFKQNEKNKKHNIINLKNMKIRDSMKNLLLKSQSQSKFIKAVKSRNNNLNTLKILTKENPISSIETENSKDLKMVQSIDNKNNINKIALSCLKLKLSDIKHDQNICIIKEENKNRYSTINNENNNKIYEQNKILKGLTKIKPNSKIKLYDTYKFKKNEEKAIDNDKDGKNKEHKDIFLKLAKAKVQKEIKAKRIFQKEA